MWNGVLKVVFIAGKHSNIDVKDVESLVFSSPV